MAGGLPKKASEFAQIEGAKIALIASQWHREIVEGMVNRAALELKRIGVADHDLSIHWLPGSGELPFAAKVLLDSNCALDAILAFGVILKGATSHDISVLQTVTQGFTALSDRYGKPIINEVIAVANIEDAKQRAGDDDLNKGLEAVFTVSELLNWKRSVTTK